MALVTTQHVMINACQRRLVLAIEGLLDSSNKTGASVIKVSG